MRLELGARNFQIAPIAEEERTSARGGADGLNGPARGGVPRREEAARRPSGRWLHAGRGRRGPPALLRCALREERGLKDFPSHGQLSISSTVV